MSAKSLLHKVGESCTRFASPLKDAAKSTLLAIEYTSWVSTHHLSNWTLQQLGHKLRILSSFRRVILGFAIHKRDGHHD